jgi:hypothetical protein
MDTFEGDAVLVDEACAAEGEVDTWRLPDEPEL